MSSDVSDAPVQTQECLKKETGDQIQCNVFHCLPSGKKGHLGSDDDKEEEEDDDDDDDDLKDLSDMSDDEEMECEDSGWYNIHVQKEPYW